MRLAPKKQRVLLVTADDKEAQLAGRWICESNLCVHRLPDPSRVIRTLTERHFDLLILDDDLCPQPERSVLRSAKQADPSVSILVVGSSPSVQSVARALKAGACEYLLKPLKKELFLDALKECLNKRDLLVHVRRLSERLVRSHQHLKIENRNLESERRRLMQFAEVGRAMTGVLEINRILDVILDGLNAIVSPAGICLLLINDRKRTLEPKIASGVGMRLFPAGAKAVQWNLDQVTRIQWLKHLVVDRKPLRCGKAGANACFDPLDIRRHFPEAILATPIVVKDKTVGVLLLVMKEQPGAGAGMEINQVRLFADFAGIALENARLYQELHVTNEKLRSMQEELMEAERLAAATNVIAGVNHELNNPLCTISLDVQLLARRLKGRIDEDTDKRLETLQSSIDRVGGITEKLNSLIRVVSKPYVESETMLDLERSCSP